MSEAPVPRAGAPARRGRPPLSSYPTASGLSRGVSTACKYTPSYTAPRRVRTTTGGPPRKRGRPPRTAAPPAEGHLSPEFSSVLSETTPASYVPKQEATQAPLKRSHSAEASPPALVFQCARCFTIVSDSFSWITAQRQLSMIVLREATDKVAVVDPPITSSEPGPTLGSRYSVLRCEQCMHHLGRKYHGTPSELEELREAFAFHVDAIIVYVKHADTRYQLGTTSASGHSIHSNVPKHSPTLVGRPGHDEWSGDTSPKIPDEPPSEMDKVRTLLMVLGERLLRVEQHLHLDPLPASDPNDDSRASP